MRATEAVSPVAASPIAMSVTAFVLTYGFIVPFGEWEKNPRL
jgi:hypothetical protein